MLKYVRWPIRERMQQLCRPGHRLRFYSVDDLEMQKNKQIRQIRQKEGQAEIIIAYNLANY